MQDTITPEYNLVFDNGVYNDKDKITATRLETNGSGVKTEVNLVTNETAVYCLFSTAVDPKTNKRQFGTLLYIGKTSAAGESTTGFRTRCLQHLDPNRDDYLHNTVDDCPDCDCWYAYANVDARSLDKCEAAMIKCFNKPPLNSVMPSHKSASRLCISGSAVPSSMHGTFVVPAE